MRRYYLPVMLLAVLALAGCMRRPVPYSYYGGSAYTAPAQPLAPQVLQYPGEPAASPAPSAHAAYVFPAAAVHAPPAEGGPYVAPEPPYTLDAGDRLRITVFGQDGLTNVYAVDASGHIAMPLIGSVPARGLTPQQLAREVAARLRRGFVREPSVSAEIVTYRPFFILGEVNNPGQYPYVAHMTVETAVAIAGGFGQRAQKDGVTVSRPVNGGVTTFSAPVTFEVKPGDTIRVRERWF